MVINVHAGHNPKGMVGCGAVGYLDESEQNRIVVGYLIEILKGCGHTVYDCTVNDGKNARDVLHKIVEKCNSHTADLDISIHHNAFKMDSGDGRMKGSEVYVYTDKKISFQYAKDILKNLVSLGFPDRGVQVHPEYYVLRYTKAPAILVECCFIDDMDDLSIYNPWECACAIACAIAGESAVNAYVKAHEEDPPIIPDEDTIYRVQIGAFHSKDLAEDLRNAAQEAGFGDAFVKVN